MGVEDGETTRRCADAAAADGRPAERTSADASLGREPGPPDDVGDDSPEDGKIERIFGTRSFFWLWIAQVVSATGDWLGLIATVALAARISAGSEGTAIALVLASRVVPGFFLATAVGVFIDRLDRKQVMVACDVGRAAVLVTLPFVDTLLGLVLASFVLELLTMMWQPAKEATVPDLVPRHKLTAANSLNLAAAYGMFPVAAGLAAMLSKIAEAFADEGWVTRWRLNEEGLAFYVDALSFLVTALIICRLAVPDHGGRERRDVPRGSLGFGGTIAELREGWRLIAGDPIVRAVNVGLATGLMGGGMLVPLGAIFVEEVIAGGEAEFNEADFNLVLFALGTGMALGVVAASLAESRINRATVFASSLFGAGLSLFAASVMDRISLMVPLVGLLGLMAGPVYVIGFTLLHENVANEMRGRVFAALFVLMRFCLLIAFFMAPLCAELLDRLSESRWDGSITVWGSVLPVPGVRLTMWVASLIVAAAGVLAFWSLRAQCKRR